MSEEAITFEQAWDALREFDWREDQLEHFIGGLGTTVPSYFSHRRSGGLMIQQVPAELAGLIRYLWKHHPKMESYLEIGIGSCGTLTVLTESWRHRGIRPHICTADNFCYAAEKTGVVNPRERFEWARDRYAIDAFIGDTSDPSFAAFLAQREFEVAFIDGDHTYAGCLRDFVHVYPRLKRGGTVIFHDISSETCPGVTRVFDFARQFFQESQTFIASGRCGIGVMTGPTRQHVPGQKIAANKAGYYVSRAIGKLKRSNG